MLPDDPFEIEDPEADVGALEDATARLDRETLLGFALVVVLIQIAFFALAVGVLLLVFRGSTIVAGVGIALGTVALLSAGLAYRRYAPNGDR